MMSDELDFDLQPANSAEECYLELIGLLIDTLKVKKILTDREIEGICQNVCRRLIEAHSPISVEKLLALERHILNR